MSSIFPHCASYDVASLVYGVCVTEIKEFWIRPKLSSVLSGVSAEAVVH
jgi:hypothetical protein